MKKSVYSLVLMDSVIKAVDEQAYRLGTNRSNLINQILAERFCCVTPEMRMREIFDLLSEKTGSNFQIQKQNSSSLITLRTSLEYKYRPIVNYKIELQREPDDFLGQLRVQIRTQSQPLISLFEEFFLYRTTLEKKYFSLLGLDYQFTLSAGYFARKLVRSTADSEKTAIAIGGYLNHLNKSLQMCFSAPNDFPSCEVENEYKELLKNFII
ncbi:MAG: hypothetical protein K2J08_13025 [Ruminococcus sp.]|nr:hypothetical protein [Ruminococcus sp.]